MVRPLSPDLPSPCAVSPLTLVLSFEDQQHAGCQLGPPVSGLDLLRLQVESLLYQRLLSIVSVCIQ